MIGDVRTIHPPEIPDTDTYDPMLAAFNRGELYGMRSARAEYHKGFTDALLTAFIFGVLGALILAVVTWWIR